jgi:curved DNA-binding protein
MAQDYYKTLGVAKEASVADIQKAYRDLARKYHPDMNPDNPKAKKKFQEVQAAFDVLNNPEKRELYDRYGANFETMAHGAPQSGGWGQAAPGGFTTEDVDFSQFFGDRFGHGEGMGLGDIFTHFRKGGGRGSAKRRGTDVSSEMTIPFATAVNGGEVQLGLRHENGDSETIVVKIPPGIEDGKKMRLRGQGEATGARGKGEAGDLLLTVHVAAHPFFTRKGNDLYVRVPVTLGEAVAGASVDVPTPSGTVALHIPPGTSSGKRLRVKGHGVPAKGAEGDLFAEVLIVLPANMIDADREAIRAIDAKSPSDPRQNLRW